MAEDVVRSGGLFRQLADRVEALAGQGGYQVECDIHRALGYTVPSGFEAQYEGARVPAYTRSRDAAAALSPKDWHSVVSGCNDSWHVQMTHTPSHSLGSVTAFAATEALARSAAALRAHAAETCANA